MDRVVRFVAFVLLLAHGAVWADGNDCHDGYWDWNNVAALTRCQVEARSGDPEAQFGYGLILWSGPPKSVDRGEALEWLRKSARQGHRLAQVTLGMFLQRPELDTRLRNRPEALAWLVRAGASKGAARLRATLSQDEKREADRLAEQFLARYPSNRSLAGER